MYDKSELITETFITALNKKISIYGSIGYFNKKTDKYRAKNSLSFQLTSVSGKLPKLKDKKIYNLSLIKKGEKRKGQMPETIETVIIHPQQNFEIAGGLNPVQIETEDDRILNILKRYKNVVHRLMLLGLLFPASVKNDTGS